MNNQKEIVEIEISKLIPHPRQNEIYKDRDLENEFLASIETRGILQPLLITQSSCVQQVAEGYYTIISGHRRYKAGKILEKETLPCIIRDYQDADDAWADVILSNLHRKKNDVEISKEIKALKKVLSRFRYLRQSLGKKEDIKTQYLENSTKEGGDFRRVQSAQTEPDIFYSDEMQKIMDKLGTNALDSGEFLAHQFGIPTRRMDQIIAVFDEEYLSKVMTQLYDKGMTIQDGDILFDEWQTIRKDFEKGDISLDSAYKQVLALKKEMTRIVNSEGKEKTTKIPQKSKDKNCDLSNLLIPVEIDGNTIICGDNKIEEHGELVYKKSWPDGPRMSIYADPYFITSIILKFGTRQFMLNLDMISEILNKLANNAGQQQQ